MGEHAFGQSMYNLEKAVRIYRQLKDKQEEAQTLESLANVSLKTFAELDDFDEPLQHCQKAMELYRELGMANSAEAGYLHQTMAFAILALDKSDDALTTGQESLNIFQLLADRRGEAAAYNVLAQIHWSRKESDKARSSVSQALKSAIDSGDTGEAAWAKELQEQFLGGGKL